MFALVACYGLSNQLTEFLGTPRAGDYIPFRRTQGTGFDKQTQRRARG